MVTNSSNTNTSGDTTNILSAIQNGVTAVSNLNRLLTSITSSNHLNILINNFPADIDPISSGSSVPSVRTLLTSTTPNIYYVRSDGNDSNNGSVNASSGAFLTWAHGINFLADTVDFGGQNVTLFNGNGATYTPAIIFQNNSWTGGGNLTFDFNGGGISSTGPKAFLLNSAVPGVVTLQNGSLKATVGAALEVSAGTIQFGSSLTFAGAGGYLIESTNSGSQVAASGVTFNISSASVGGGAMIAEFGGNIFMVGATVNFLGDFNSATAFAVATALGQIQAGSMTFTLNGHSITGSRYIVTNGGHIQTGSGSSTYFPGDASGTGSNFGVSPFGMYV